MTDLDEVDLGERLVASRLLDIQYRDDVLVVEVAEQLHLTQSSETEHGVVKGSDLLDGNLLAGWLVKSGTIPRISLGCKVTLR